MQPFIVSEEAPPGNITELGRFSSAAEVIVFCNGQKGRQLIVDDTSAGQSHVVVSDGANITTLQSTAPAPAPATAPAPAPAPAAPT